MPEERKNVSEAEAEVTTAESGPEAVESTAEAVVAAERAVPEPEASKEASAPEPAPEPEPVVPEAADEAAEPSAETSGAEAEPSAGQDATTEAAATRKRRRLPRASRRQRPPTKRTKAAARKPITRLPKPEHERGRRQERQGTVVSAAADKTIVVRVDVVKIHPVYKKVIRRSTRLHAHDEQNRAKLGDVVRIVETRPLSRMKRWRLQEIVEAAK